VHRGLPGWRAQGNRLDSGGLGGDQRQEQARRRSDGAAIRIAIGEEFGCEPARGKPKARAALRRLGFDDVFDTNFAADLTILEEGTELLSA
jgi:iron only hydrogenase large subunit-like protein